MKRPEFQKKDLTVALLMDNARQAAEVSRALREVGIFAHFYSELDEFWMATKLQTPDLSIVDVAKMSFGDTTFKNHPKVKDGSLCTVFFYSRDTQVLLQSALQLPAFGYLCADVGLVEQVRTLSERRRSELALEIMSRDLNERISRLQTRSTRMITERNEAEEFKTHFEAISKLCNVIEEDAIKSDFVTALFSQLSKWDAVKMMGMYELGHNRQKLTSPDMQKSKWTTLPGLWIGKVCDQGIEPFALDMSWQVARDIFETEPVELKLLGGALHPELIVFVEVDQQRLLEFPWDLMNQMLTASYRRWKLNREMPRPQVQAMPVWEALDHLDNLSQPQMEASEKLAIISFTPLLTMINKKANNRFHFTACMNDFFLQLGDALHPSTRFSYMGPWHIVLFIQKNFLEREFNMARDVVNAFPFWRFFEDETKLLGVESKPSIKILAPSAVNYLRTLEREFDELPILEAQAKMQQRLHQPSTH